MTKKINNNKNKKTLDVNVSTFINNIKPIFNLLTGFNINMDSDTSKDYTYALVSFEAENNNNNKRLLSSFIDKSSSILDKNFENVYTSKYTKDGKLLEASIYYDKGL